MKKLEKISIAVIVAGVVGSLLQIDYSNAVFMIGCTLLAMIYFGLGFALFNDVSLRSIGKAGSFKSVGRLVGSIAAGVALSIVVIGVQFKFLILQGAGEMLVIGTTLLAIIAIVALAMFIIRYKGESSFYKGVFIRIIPALVIGFLSWQVSADCLIDIRYRDNPKLAGLIKQSHKDPQNQKLIDQIQKELEKED